MPIGFDNIHLHTTALDGSFFGKWFDGQVHPQHLGLIQPLDAAGARFVWDFISDTDLHHDAPFKKGFFRHLDQAPVGGDDWDPARKWLYRRGLPFDTPVLWSRQPGEALLVPWKMIVKYPRPFYFGGDVTVIPPGLEWALLMYHEDEFYFGTNRDYVPGGEYSDEEFTW